MYRIRIDKPANTYSDEAREKYDEAVQLIASAIAALGFGSVSIPALPARPSSAAQPQQASDVAEEQDTREREDTMFDTMLG